MAPPRSYDLDEFKRLLRKHPDWTYTKLAMELTKWNKAHGRDVRVDSHTLSSAVSQRRAEWEAEGVLQARPIRASGLFAQLTSNTGIKVPNGLQTQTELRRLRGLDRLAAGLPVTPEGEGQRALEFERRLRRDKQVVDLHSDGVVLIRAAAPWELDQHGELVSIIAAYRPPTHRR